MPWIHYLCVISKYVVPYEVNYNILSSIFLGDWQTEIRRGYSHANDARSKTNEISPTSLCCKVVRSDRYPNETVSR